VVLCLLPIVERSLYSTFTYESQAVSEIVYMPG
jgi:hypothetical protein